MKFEESNWMIGQQMDFKCDISQENGEDFGDVIGGHRRNQQNDDGKVSIVIPKWNI